MSYDFRLRIPDAQRKPKRKRGPHPEQVQRLQRAREILLSVEPDIVIHDDGDGMFTAHSAEIGDIYVEYDRISLAMSMGAEPRAIYTAIHGLMKRFHTEGYEASDPQVADDIVYRESFVDFMRQYRVHFRCNDAEFDDWCRGNTPPAWAERAAERERGDALAAVVMPRGWELTWAAQKALSDDELWQHLHDLVRRNDAAAAEHGLGPYLQLLSSEQQRENPRSSRRLDGSYYPYSEVPWYQGSLLHYEAGILHDLRCRGYAAALRDRPQRVCVMFELPADAPISNAHHLAVHDTMRPLGPVLREAGLIDGEIDAMAEGNSWECALYGEDADAIHAALMQHLSEPGRYQPTRLRKRYGDVGAQEVTVPWVAHS